MDEATFSPRIRRQGVNNNAMPVADIIFMTLRHWPWIIVSLVVCLGLAYFYILSTPKIHTRSAEILIKDEDKGKSLSMEDFADMGLFQSNSNIHNEIITLKSKDLMDEVIHRLGLDMNFYRQEAFHRSAVYGLDMPLKIELVDFPEEGRLSFTIEVNAKGNVELHDLKTAKESYDEVFKGQLGDSIATPVGKIYVAPSATYKKGKDIELIVEKMPMTAACLGYTNGLEVRMTDEKGSVLKLTFSDESVQRADDVLNTLIGVYNESWIRDKNQVAVSTSNFINDRLGVIEDELGNVDSDISSFKSENLVPDIQTASTMYMSQSQETSAQILALNNQLQVTRYLRSYLTNEASRLQLLPSNAGVNDPTLELQIAAYNERLLQRNAMAAKSSDKNPLVANMDELLASQRKAIIGTVDNQIVNLNTQIKGLQQSEAKTISRIASNPSQAKYLLSVERQQKVKESLYLFLLQKREENELSQAFTAYNTRVVNKPGDDGVPPSPNARNILLIAGLLGLFIPFGVTYVREVNNTKVRGRKDVENLSVPFLGEIPENVAAKKNKGDEESKEIIVKEGKRDVINEAFRVLRTNFEFMNNDGNGANVIAITSFNPHSGKSFISVNLTKALSLKGKRVLVIDGDMRHGSSSAYISSPAKGLSDYLNGSQPDLNSLIVPVEGSKSLFMLPIGTVPPNPAELLSRPVFASMLETLRKEFDYILIDCPPIEVVADAQIIDRYVDRTVFVIRAGLLERAMLPELEKLYKLDKYKNMSVILNGTSNNQGRYGYSHGYRYGYGYGYGYGYNYGSDKNKK